MSSPRTPIEFGQKRPVPRRLSPWLGALTCLPLLALMVAFLKLRPDPGALVLATEDQGTAVWIEADGTMFLHHTRAQTAADLLHEAGVNLHAHDRLYVQEQEIDPLTPLNDLGSEAHVVVERAIPFTLDMDGIQTRLYAPAGVSVGEGLWRAGVPLYGGDSVHPSFDAPLLPDMQVHVQHSEPLTIVSDEGIIRTRTHKDTIQEALAEEGIELAGQDYCDPPPTDLVAENPQVYISRIAEEWVAESEAIPYDTVWQPDSELELDRQRVAQGGEEGIRKRRFRIVYENGREVGRYLEEEWVEKDPEPRILVYGTKIVLRDIQTPQGPKRYWRHLRVLATSYTAATSGKTRDHPQFGITRLGWWARKGIIAVDPTVIPMRANMYVPGYGPGVAGDTGGAIKGRRIDLCYEEDDLVLWYRWVDVYLLEPVPPRSQIPWTLPNWPAEK